MYGGKWISGVITKGLESGTYVVNHGSQIMYINQGPANIRAHQMTAAEKAVADQSAQAGRPAPARTGKARLQPPFTLSRTRPGASPLLRTLQQGWEPQRRIVILS
jgi:hypothetical protein